MQATVIVLFIAFVIWALIDALIILRDLRDEGQAVRRAISQSRDAKWQ